MAGLSSRRQLGFAADLAQQCDLEATIAPSFKSSREKDGCIFFKVRIVGDLHSGVQHFELCKD
jgi:hypothetical protein